MRLAWTQERFSSPGTFDTFRDMALIPKPSQHPHPPLHHAATSRETFAAIGTLGCPLLVGLASAAMAELAEGIVAYQAAWQEAGHPGPRPGPCPPTSACDQSTSGAPRRSKTLRGPHGPRDLRLSPLRTCCTRAWGPAPHARHGTAQHVAAGGGSVGHHHGAE